MNTAADPLLAGIMQWLESTTALGFYNAGDWQLAARLAPDPKRCCCAIYAVLAPRSVEHTSLDALLVALDAARASQSDGEAMASDRAELHLAAAQAYYRAADLATAQWHSYEALRLSMQTSMSIFPQQSNATLVNVDGSAGRRWRAVGLRIAALLQGARLCEASASPEEALDGFKQARKLVSLSTCKASNHSQGDTIMLRNLAMWLTNNQFFSFVEVRP